MPLMPKGSVMKLVEKERKPTGTWLTEVYLKNGRGGSVSKIFLL